MAIFRKIHTQFWSDTFVQSLSPERKYFYLYLLTNEKTKQCGIYEISTRQISYDTGYTVETVLNLLEYFISTGKILFSRETSEIAIKNWNRYNESRSPGVQKCINQEIRLVKNQQLVEWVQSGGTVGTHITQEEEEPEEEENKNKSADVEIYTQPKMLLTQAMLKVWLELNTDYKPLESDFKGLRHIAVFISGRTGIEHLSKHENEVVLKEWGKWCFYILQSKFKNYSLDKIGRWNCQEIHQELKNPTTNGNNKINRSSNSADGKFPQTDTL
jgi:hypothetical protein